MAANLFPYPVLVDTDGDGIADGLEKSTNVAGTVAWSLVTDEGGVAAPLPTAQRFAYTGVAGDSNKQVAVRTVLSEAGGIAEGEPLCASFYVRGSLAIATGCLPTLYVYNSSGLGLIEMIYGIDWIIPTTIGTRPAWKRFYVSSASLPAGASRFRLSVNIEGIDSGNVTSVDVCGIKVEKAITPTAYNMTQDLIAQTTATLQEAIANALASTREHAEALVTDRDYDGPWTRLGPVISASEAWEANSCQEPSVLAKGDGTYEAWYDGVGGIGYATAPSLLGPYTKFVGNPVNNTHTRSRVFMVGDVYHMIAALSEIPDGEQWLTQLHFDHFTSDDGKSWTLSQGSILSVGGVGTWDHHQVGSTSLPWLEDGVWYMLYEARADASSTFYIGLATATGLDGPWTKAPPNPVLGTATMEACRPFVIKKDGVYYCWFHGGRDTVFPTEMLRAHATSPYEWVVDANKLLVSQGQDEGAWAGGQIADPCVVDGGDGYLYLFYTACGTTTAQIKLARAPITDLATIKAKTDSVLLKTDTIGTLAVTVTSPVAAGGTITIEQGDSYPAGRSRAIDVNVDDPTHAKGLDATNVTVYLLATQFTWTASSVTSTAGGYRVRFEPTIAQTAAVLREQSYKLKACIDQVAPTDDDAETIQRGRVVLNRDIPAV